MKTVETIQEIHEARRTFKGSVGLVPTMGFLHEGHLSLIRVAKAACAHVIVTIFVNPTQFGEGENLDSYPQDLHRDLILLEEAGVDLVWMPTREVMYPEDFQTWVDVSEVTQPLEGGMRPGHFKGVTTIVAKLFNGAQPDKAFFGQKDAQQVAVIQQMVRDLNFALEIVVVSIAREEDGLARSSRNVHLSKAERGQANVLFRALGVAEAAYAAGERDGEEIRQAMLTMLGTAPLANPQYISCAHPSTLEELFVVGDAGALLSMAVYFGKTRLIDNWVLK